MAGPHTFNFAEATETAVALGAALQCQDLQAAILAVCELVQQPQKLLPMKTAALHWVGQHRGAAKRTVVDLQAKLLH